MDVSVVNRFTSTLPADDDHPYRTGPWRPQTTEFDAVDCDVEGQLPDDLNGVYLRNTENPLLQSLGQIDITTQVWQYDYDLVWSIKPDEKKSSEV